MSKYTEAIILVREMLNTTEPNVMNHLAANRKLDHELQELVNKATPKKPKEQLIDNYCRGIPGETSNEKELNYFCSNCNELVGDELFKYNFCPNCGQAIDWGKQ